MDLEIALLLAQDGVANGAIYVLAAIGLVLIFAVTRVVFVSFGDIAAYAALSQAALQTGQLPGTVYLIMTLAGLATFMEVVSLLRGREAHRLPRAVLWYLIVPLLPVALTYTVAGKQLPLAIEIAVTLALVLPIGPLLYRIAFRPLADASVLVLLTVAVSLHFAVSGLALLFFGPEGQRTRPIFRGSVDMLGTSINAQTLLIVGASVVFSFLLYLFFGRTLTGKALRATAINRVGARLVGIRPTMTAAIAFIVSSVIAGVSGILIGPVTTLYYDSGFIIGLKAFVGAILGGLVSYPLAALGALFVGLLESYASFWNSSMKEVVVFSLLIPVLLWRSLSAPQTEEESDEEVEK